MTLIAWLFAGLVLGAIVSAVYFGGLWFTVRRFSERRQPWLAYACSLLARLALVLATVWCVLRVAPPPMLGGVLIGFFLVRAVAVRWLGSETSSPSDRLAPPEKVSRT